MKFAAFKWENEILLAFGRKILYPGLWISQQKLPKTYYRWQQTTIGIKKNVWFAIACSEAHSSLIALIYITLL